MKTYYELLGVARTATTDEISSAYRRLAARYHPDRHQGNELQALAEEKLKDLNEAHQILSKPNLRNEYDAAIDGRLHGSTPSGVAQPTVVHVPLGAIFARWVFLGLLLMVAVRVFHDPRLVWVVLAGWVAWRVVRARRG